MSDDRTFLSIQPGDTLLGRYRLERILGRGGMGVVWKAQDLQLSKPVAVKLLPPELVHDQNALDRLKAEARRGQSLAHPGVVTLHDFQQDPVRGNIAFLVMEFVEGKTLSDLLKDHRQGLPLERVVKWARQMAEAIDFAHSKEILHRDIKPGNVMIDAKDNARLIDFGIGREVRNTMSQVSVRPDSSGTPAYMSPQQLMGENHKSNDIYSLAATVYECVGGSPPFVDGHIQTQILKKPAPPLPNAPTNVNAALQAGLAKEIPERPKTSAAFVLLLTERSVRPQVVTTEPFAPPMRISPHNGGNIVPKERSANSKPAWKQWTDRHDFITVCGALAAIGVLLSSLLLVPWWLSNRHDVPSGGQSQATTPLRHLARKTVEFAPGVTAEFVYIDAPGVAPDGFLMGSPAAEEGRSDDETQHRVKLTKGFWMQTAEVTQAQWLAVMDSNPSSFTGDPRLPVEQVSWEDCQQFIASARSRGIAARLPTEAEWEFACRAGTMTPFSFGATISTKEANYDGNYTYGSGRKGVNRQKTTPVGMFPANAWGLHDMHGNVMEWCQDWLWEYPRDGAATNPTGPQAGGMHVGRGGSWYSRTSVLRSAYRFGSFPADRYHYIGFRLCLDSN